MAKLADALDLGSSSARNVGSTPSPSTNSQNKRRQMKINSKEITAKYFAYDGCHKIYLINNEEEMEDCLGNDYKVYPIDKLQEKFEKSCGLRFISHWNLEEEDLVKQFEIAKFQV
jgi:hypothetical protein